MSLLRPSPRQQTDSIRCTPVCWNSSSYSLFLDRPRVHGTAVSTMNVCTPRMGHRAVLSGGRLSLNSAMTLRGGIR